VHAVDPDNDPLSYWVDGLPGGAIFDPTNHTLTWTPDFGARGTYPVRFTVGDGRHQVSGQTTVLIAPGNQVPSLVGPADRTLSQGQPIRIPLQAADADGDPLTFSSANLPAGAVLDPATGVFAWTPAFAQEGTFAVSFTVSDGVQMVTRTTQFTV